MRVAVDIHVAADDLPSGVNATRGRGIGCSAGSVEREHLATCEHESVPHSRLVRIPVPHDISLGIDADWERVESAGIIQVGESAILINEAMRRESTIDPNHHDHANGENQAGVG